jgi:signal transduction histidine kinase/CheY-like chemotaxis protein
MIMAIPLRVLIAEDRPSDAELMVYELKRSGYVPEWKRVETEEEYVAELQSIPEVILADNTLPDFGALQALTALKNSGLDIPLVMVTGSISEEVAVERIKQGASDYILKDRMARLGPAVKRALEEKILRDEKRKANDLLRRNLQRIKALHEINVAITSTLDLHTVLDVLLEKIDQLLPLGAAITVRLLSSGRLLPAACRNIDENEWKAARTGPGTGPAQRAFETTKPVVIRNVQVDPNTRDSHFAKKYGLFSRLVIPLIAKEQPLGILSLYTREEREFTDEEVELLVTLAGQAAIAIHNAQIYTAMENSNRVKSEFLSVVSHELRTPLNVVMSYASMIKDKIFGEINTAQENALSKILLRGNEQLKLINSILYTTSLETHEAIITNQRIDLTEFLDELQSSYVTFETPTLRIDWDYSSNLPDITTDRTKLRQIFDNLISNAIKFTPQGRVSISVRHFPEREQLIFEVADNGIGIPTAMLPFVFDKFRQGDSSNTRSYAGVGLGLYIAQEFARLLGGSVTVESEVEKGSTFTVTLPYEKDVSA